ncbi:MAG: hypothetical protein K0Q71_5197, partial [Thermomicrobiales bacterium]|nr:hypothetical protein [Thermomicrobiales bacterium]
CPKSVRGYGVSGACAIRQNATVLDAEGGQRLYWYMSPKLWNL